MSLRIIATRVIKSKCVCACVCADSSMLTDMMKGNLTNVLPMIVIGGWINWAFSGFVISKLLLLSFLISFSGGFCLITACVWCSQGSVPSDTEVQAHVAARHRPAVAGRILVSSSSSSSVCLVARFADDWCVSRVSSASWYFLNVFGLRSMYSLILGQDNGGSPTGSAHTH